MIDLAKLTIMEARRALDSKEFTARELVEQYLKTIKEKNKSLNAYLEVFDDVLEQADRADMMMKNGEASLLTGIPIALKDNILVDGKRVTAGSKILEGYTATYDATIVRELKKQGAVIMGRTNMDEFAMGSSTQTSAYGVTKNPYDETRVPGGSSGGAAVTVAANMSLVALGSETCGSVRQPASFCGLVGLKPTYGAVSRSGLIAMGNSLDQIAPFTKTVAESEILFNTLAQHDEMDATSVPTAARKGKQVRGKKIGIPRSFLLGGGIDKYTLENFEASVKKLEHAGYEVVDVDLPTLKYSLAVYYIIMPAEVSTNLSRFDGIRYGLRVDAPTLEEVYTKTRGLGFGVEARRRILLGTFVLSHGYYDAYYNKAITVRDTITSELIEIFESVDFLMTPTTPTPAFKLGEKLDDPVAMYLSDIFSAPANLSGIPSIALPSGKTPEGLPLSIQFMTPHFTENSLFAIGKEFETLV